MSDQNVPPPRMEGRKSAPADSSLDNGGYALTWDNYVQAFYAKNDTTDIGEWPGDEWGLESHWAEIFNELFLASGSEHWTRAVEVGAGSGKYTLKLLASSQATVRAYDVSEAFLGVLRERLKQPIADGRLIPFLLDAATPDEMLADLEQAGWRRNVDAFFSIDAMVHIDLQYLTAYLITAALVLKKGGKLILSAADATNEIGFKKLLNDIRAFFPLQNQPTAKFEWLSPDLLRSILDALGFQVTFHSPSPRDIFLVAELVDLEKANEFEQYLR